MCDFFNRHDGGNYCEHPDGNGFCGHLSCDGICSLLIPPKTRKWDDIKYREKVVFWACGILILAVALSVFLIPEDLLPPLPEPVQEPFIRVIQSNPDAAELCVNGKTYFSCKIDGGSVFAVVLGPDRKPIPCSMEE